MKKVISILLIVFAFNFCTKSPGNGIIFTGLTKTNAFGFPLSNDTTDWRMDDIWVKQESDLFTSNHPTGCTPDGNYRISAYPNPCTDLFMLEMYKSDSSRVELRLVDKNFRKLFSSDSITAAGIQFDTNSFGVKGIIRVYYKVIKGNCEFRGHGDVQIQ